MRKFKKAGCKRVFNLSNIMVMIVSVQISNDRVGFDLDPLEGHRVVPRVERGLGWVKLKCQQNPDRRYEKLAVTRNISQNE